MASFNGLTSRTNLNKATSLNQINSAYVFNPASISGLVMAVGSQFGSSYYNLDHSTDPPSTVTQLIDYSGNAPVMAQTSKNKQPTWDETQSPFPGVQLDGDSNTTNADWIECTSNSAIAATNTITIFAVVKAPNSQNGSFRHIIRKWDDAGSQGWMLRTDATTSSPTGAQLLVNNTATVFTGNCIGSSKVLLTGVINNGVTAAYVNGGSSVTGSYTVGAGVNNTKTLTIGGRNTGASAWNGTIWLFYQYNRVLNSTEIDTVRAGINLMMGIY